MPAAPDDFTNALLHAIQDERTTPSGGWLDARQLSLTMSLAAHEEHHLKAPLQELHEAGMIEKRFNARTGRDEWRSRGVQPATGREQAPPLAYMPLPESTGAEEFTVTIGKTQDVEVALNQAVNQLRNAGAPAALMGHFSFRLGYHYGGGEMAIKPAVAWAAKECAIGVIFT